MKPSQSRPSVKPELRLLVSYQGKLEESLLIGDEALMCLCREQQRLAGWSAWRPEWGGGLDRDGEGEALAAALASLRVVRVGKDMPGQVLPLVQAWADREGWRGELPVEGPGSGPDAVLVLVIGSVPQVMTFEAADLDQEPRRKRLGELLARDGHVVVATSSGWIGRALPALAQAPVVELAARRDADLLPRWLAVRPRAGSETGKRYDLFTLFDAIAAADEEDRWSLDWARLAPWTTVPSRHRPRSALLLRLLKSKRPLPFPQGVVFERFVQTEARLRWLVELDGTLP